MRIGIIAKFFTVICFAAAAANAISAQDGSKSRSITSDDFASQRPAAAKATGKKTQPKAKHFKYKYVRTATNGNKKATPKAAAAKTKITAVGVTMWRLRPPRGNESGQFLPVIDEQKTRQMWLAERVGIDTTFSAGDKIRFAIESSQVGYLYVFDRETFADGTLGQPYLIFPESPLDDNSVAPGVIVDIPDQRDDVPYFNISSKNTGYSGELMTIIISPEPIANFNTDREGKLANSDDLTTLEFGMEAELFSRDDSDDKMFSKAEADAACGSKARQYEKSRTVGKPCGVKTRQLTRDEPFPQSIFQVKSLTNQPAAVFIKLAVK